MNEETGFLAAVLRELGASTAVILAAWGALGGATNALTTRMRLRDALRHILLGGLIAAGMGSLSMALVARWLGLPLEAIPAGGAAGSAGGRRTWAEAALNTSRLSSTRGGLKGCSSGARAGAGRGAG